MQTKVVADMKGTSENSKKKTAPQPTGKVRFTITDIKLV